MRWLSRLLVMVVVVGSATLWAAGGVLPGSGAEGDPYLIEDLADFDVFADSVNAATYWASDVYTRLACDPNLAGRIYTTAVIAPDTVNGNSTFEGTPFTGFFDGGGHIINNLSIDAAATSNDFLGLFGKIIGHSTSNSSMVSFENLGLRNVNVIGGIGSDYVGGLCGWNETGWFRTCHVVGSVSGDYGVGGLCGYNWNGFIYNSYAIGSVRGSEKVGGLCGYNHQGSPYYMKGSIRYCYSSSSVTGGDYAKNLGGLCGMTFAGRIHTSYSAGTVTGGNKSSYIGGLCGHVSGGEIEGCYSTASITVGEGSAVDNIGGFTGSSPIWGACSGDIRACFWDVETSGIGLAGDDNCGAVGKTTEQMQTASTFTDVGWDFYRSDGASWYMPRDSYPKLDWERTLGFEGECERFEGQTRRFSFEIDICNLIDETQAWTITGDESCEWIRSVSPRSGISEGAGDKTTVTIDVDSTGLGRGEYLCELWVLAESGDSIVIPVLLHVKLLGNGTGNDPWVIRSLEDFDEFAGEPRYWDDHVILETDIDLAGRTYSAAVIAPSTFTGNGDVYRGTAFSGVFCGSGHVIRNLTIDTEGASTDYHGLFGKIQGSSAEVTHLGLENFSIRTGDYSQYLGGLCGRNGDGTITRCYSIGTFRGGRHSGCLGGLCGWNSGVISSCYSDSSVIGGYESRYLGGLCGYISSGVINNCYAMGSVSGGYGSRWIGGLCGASSSSIIDCYSLSRVDSGYASSYLGGLCGSGSNGTISNCFWDVETSGIGLAGDDNYGATGKTTEQMQTESTFRDAGWDFDPSDTVGWDMVSGEYPQLAKATIACVGATEIFCAETAKGTSKMSTSKIRVFSPVDEVLDWTISGYEGCEWIINVAPQKGRSTGRDDKSIISIDIDTGDLSVGDYTCELTVSGDNGDHLSVPIVLHIQLSGSGTENDPWIIRSAGGLYGLSGDSSYWDDYVRLEGDIDLSGYDGVDGREVWRPIGYLDLAAFRPVPFTGEFDGNGKRVSGFSFASGDEGYFGLFGCVEGEGALIKDVGLVGPVVSTPLGYETGGLVGHLADGEVVGCWVEGGQISGGSMTGGLVGNNYGGAMLNCSAEGEVQGEDKVGGVVGYSSVGSELVDCRSESTVSGDYEVGGLAGESEGMVRKCSAVGDVDGVGRVGGLIGSNTGTVVRSYAASGVSGGEDVGGFVGENTGHNVGVIEDCYALGNVSGENRVGGFAGVNWLGQINMCFSSGIVGVVGGSENVGGLIGYDIDGTYEASFWDVDGSGQMESPGGIGKTAGEMQTRSTFTNADWDFVGEDVNGVEDVWRMCVDGVGYPRLSWEYGSIGDFACGDGVGFEDVVYLCERWLMEDEFAGAADGDGDGVVDFGDFGILVEHFLEE